MTCPRRGADGRLCLACRMLNVFRCPQEAPAPECACSRIYTDPGWLCEKEDCPRLKELRKKNAAS